MTDPAEALTGLRPIHLPADSSEVFVTAAAMVAGILAALAIAAMVRLLLHRWGSERRAALDELARSRSLAPDERLAAQAKLLRRIVRTIDGQAPRGLSEGEWLTRLDRALGTSFFTSGAGQVYGNALYRRPSADNVETLDQELSRLIAGMSPRASARAAQ